MKKVWGYFHCVQILICCQSSIIVAKNYKKISPVKRSGVYDTLLHTNFELHGKGLDHVVGDLMVDCFGAAVYAVCQGILQDTLSTKDQIESMHDLQIQQSVNIPPTDVSDNLLHHEQLIVQHDVSLSDVCHENNQNDVQANIQGAMPLVVVTNPIGITAIVTAVAAVLVVDQLACMGLIDRRWSLTCLKEKIFGVKIYEGDEYYKNWRNPKNLERSFPHFDAHEGVLKERYVYEQEMSNYLKSAKNMLEIQDSLKTLPWHHRACEKILNFTLTADPIYISENEEFQLDVRLTQELANCRNSALRDMKKNITNLYRVFESLSNELVYQLKKSVKDLLKFKVDAKLLAFASIVMYDTYQTDEHDELFDAQDLHDSQALQDSVDDYLSEICKQDITKIFTNCSQYHKLLEDFEMFLDFNDEFYQLYSSKFPRFIFEHNHDVAKISVASIIGFIRDKVSAQKAYMQQCLQKIEEYCKKIDQSKIIPHVTKSLKKSTASRFSQRNKKIEQRLQSDELISVDIIKLLLFDRLNLHSQQWLADLVQEFDLFIQESLRDKK